MEFAHACKGVGVRPIIGCELTVEVPRRMPRPVHVTLLVENARGWASLCRLITEAHCGTREGAGMREALPPSIEIDELERHTEGLVCLSGCARDGAVAGNWERGDPAGATYLARRLLRAFGPSHFRIELQRPLWRHDRSRNRWLTSLAERLGVPAVATGDAHAHDRSRLALQDAMVAVRLGATLDETEALRRGNSASALLSADRAATRFRDHPEALAETARLAERLRFDLTREIGYSYPGAEEDTAAKRRRTDRRLAELCRLRLVHRYEGTPHRAEAERRLDEELALIRELRLSGFFLLHQDMLELAREVAAEVRGPDSARRLLPPGRGRGSSVSSLVCYLTGLSHIDPVKNDLFLGRFLNEELTEVPDIDLDFPRDIREKLIPRVHERYGPERSALVASFATYKARGAIRDLGKALGLPLGEVERFARAVDVYEASRDAWARMEETLGKLRARSPRWRALAELLPEIAGLPRHISQHPGGMVISTTPLIELCPVQPAAMEGRQIVQWDKDSCADAGFLKIDLLGLGMLSAVERCVDEIARTRGERIDLSHVPLDDDEVWTRDPARGDHRRLPDREPGADADAPPHAAAGPRRPDGAGRPGAARSDPGRRGPPLHRAAQAAAGGSLVRGPVRAPVAGAGAAGHPRRDRLPGPGARGGDGAGRLLRRRGGGVAAGDEPQALAGGDGALPASGSSRARSAAGSRARWRSGSTARSRASRASASPSRTPPPSGCSPTSRPGCGSTTGRSCSARCSTSSRWASTRRTRWSTRRSGAASRSWLRTSTSASWTAGWRRRAPRAGSAGNPPVRIGLGYVAEVAEVDAQAVIDERRRGRLLPEHLGPRRALGRGRGGPAAVRLGGSLRRPRPAGVGAGRPRRSSCGGPALWEVGGSARAARTDDGAQLALPLDGSPTPPLPQLGPWERIVADYRTTGMTLGRHPMELIRGNLPSDVLTSEGLGRTRDGARVKVAGMVVARQRPATANGVVFMLLEDERGTINLIVPPPVVERYRLAVRTSGFVLAAGKLEHREGTTNVVVTRIDRLSTDELPPPRIRELEPPVHRETGRDPEEQPQREPAMAGPSAVGLSKRGFDGVREAAMAELAASLPAPHSFGRRGR